MKTHLGALRRAASLALLLLCLVPHAASAYYYYEPYEEVIAVIDRTFSLELWHYSGGFWLGTDLGGRQIRVSDRQIDAAALCGYLNSTQYVCWTGQLPEAAVYELSCGGSVRVSVEGRSDLYSGAIGRTLGPSHFEIQVQPVFHVASNATLNSFVSGIRATIPLVSSAYGCNLYSLYGFSGFGVISPGLFLQSDPSRQVVPYMHPSVISTSLGFLKGGYTILAGGEQTASDGWSVGLLTLPAGGAVGLRFDFPVRIVFTALRAALMWADDLNADSEVADVPGTPSGPGNAPIPPPPDFSGDYPYFPSYPSYPYEEPPVPVFDPNTAKIHRLY